MDWIGVGRGCEIAGSEVELLVRVAPVFLFIAAFAAVEVPAPFTPWAFVPWLVCVGVVFGWGWETSVFGPSLAFISPVSLSIIFLPESGVWVVAPHSLRPSLSPGFRMLVLPSHARLLRGNPKQTWRVPIKD